ncbi:MAG: hypothetical protein HY727_12250 [Candidatus Rokubacteria bacterium]|nr:hypothetical protein [Candidatus Rokubacteria bacterium]
MAQISFFGLSAVLVALALFVWRAKPGNQINRWFAVQTVFFASWVFGIGGLQGGIHLDVWGRFTFASASLIPAAFLAFTQCYPTPSRWPQPLLSRTIFAIAVAFAVLSLTTPLLVYDVSVGPEGLVRRTGPLYPAFSVYFLITWLAALCVFVRKWLNSRGRARAQLQYLGTGIIISGAGGIGVNLLLPLITGRSTYSWMGPYFSLVFVAMVAHAIIRHRLMDLRLAINRSLAYAVAIVCVSAVIITLGRFAVRGWTAGTVPLPHDVLVILVVGLLMLSTPIQSLFDRLIDPYLYRGRIEYPSALREATHRLSRLMQPAELAAELRQILTAAFVPDSFAMLVKPFEAHALDHLGEDTPAVVDLLTIAILTTDRSSPSVLMVNPGDETGPSKIAHDALRASGIEIVVTLGRRGQLLGAILLGPRKSGDTYFAKDLAFIESLAELASIALDNALLYRQRIQILEYSERLLESLDSAVVAVDVVGKIASFNPAAKTLLGLRDATRGAPLDAVPPEIGWALALAIRGSSAPREVEAKIDHEARGLLPVILSTAVLHDDRQEITGALVVVTDLSTVKALERNQRRVEHLALMARFYAGIAHEIRSPLTSISNFIAMLPDRFNDPEYRDTAVRLLPIEVARIVRLADRLRLMAPSEGGTLTRVALGRLLSDIVAIHTSAAEEQGVKILLHCPEELPRILGDTGQLIQLFVNLLNNAAEAMLAGGLVLIEVVHISERSGSELIRVRVIDDGVGISPTLRNRIFQPFFTTKPAGTGLGLPICREIADFHHARLELLPQSSGRGTIAQIEFPCLALEATDQHESFDSRGARGSHA